MYNYDEVITLEDLNIKINYLYHSGFSVETEHCFLVFDYYQGPIQLSDKNIFVFSSHSHPDHFNPVIFEWQQKRTDIQYILSSDINIPENTSNIQSISLGEEIQVNGLTIKAYNSTDLGVSFLVQCERIRIFHSGDFNWWYWIDTPEEMAKAEKEFKDEIEKLKKERIDIAFFPVDPRLEEKYSAGAEYFIQEIRPQYLIPMHFSTNPQAAKTFAQKMKGCPTQILALTEQGQKISLSLNDNQIHLK